MKVQTSFHLFTKGDNGVLPWSHTKFGKKICPNWVQFCVDPKWIMSSFNSYISSLKIGEISMVKKTLNKSHLSGPRILDLFWFFFKRWPGPLHLKVSGKMTPHFKWQKWPLILNDNAFCQKMITNKGAKKS